MRHDAEDDREGVDVDGRRMARRIRPSRTSRNEMPAPRRVTSEPASSSGSFTLRFSVRTRRSGRARARAGPLPERRRHRRRSRSRAASTSSTTSAMPSHGIRPPRNASTATSLAALRVAGAPPPARPAAYARPRHGNASRSGVSKVSDPRRVQSMAPKGWSSRSGAPSARPIGRRMSGIESWATVAPSVNSTIPWTTDCGCTTTSIAVEVDAEQLVRLDHLEALVHERRRVDRDLGAHGPGRVLAARRRR